MAARSVRAKVKSNTKSQAKSQPKPEVVLRSFLARFDDEVQKLFFAVRAAIKKRLPAANELAYDYTGHIVVAYAPTDRGIDGIVALDARTDGVRLYFNQGPQLPDPKGLLQGSGKMARYLAVTSARQLAEPDVDLLLCAAVEIARVPLPTEGKGQLTIRTGGDGTKKSPRTKTARKKAK